VLFRVVRANRVADDFSSRRGLLPFFFAAPKRGRVCGFGAPATTVPGHCRGQPHSGRAAQAGPYRLHALLLPRFLRRRTRSPQPRLWHVRGTPSMTRSQIVSVLRVSSNSIASSHHAFPHDPVGQAAAAGVRRCPFGRETAARTGHWVRGELAVSPVGARRCTRPAGRC